MGILFGCCFAPQTCWSGWSQASIEAQFTLEGFHITVWQISRNWCELLDQLSLFYLCKAWSCNLLSASNSQCELKVLNTRLFQSSQTPTGPVPVERSSKFEIFLNSSLSDLERNVSWLNMSILYKSVICAILVLIGSLLSIFLHKAFKGAF